MSAPRLYLDHAATTPIVPEAQAAMAEALAQWANPSSPHAEGRAAKARLEDYRARCKAALGWDGELIFTSGASEAIGIIFERAEAHGTRLVSAVEHSAVLRAAGEAAVRLPVTIDGALDIDALEEALATASPPAAGRGATGEQRNRRHPPDGTNCGAGARRGRCLFCRWVAGGGEVAAA